VQQELHRIGAFVVAEQHRRLAIGELERHAAGVVLAPGAVEVADHRAVLAAVDPGIAGAELEPRQAGIRLDRGDRVHGRLDVQAVHLGGLLGDFLLSHHGRSPHPVCFERRRTARLTGED
jgi:hypothetical protein